MFPFINPFLNNRRAAYPRLNQFGTPILHTIAAITHLIDAQQVVTYSLHPRLFRLLPARGILLLEVRSQATPTPADANPVYLSVTGNPLGASSNRIPLMLHDGTQATYANITVGGHYLVSYNRCECSFQLLNPIVPLNATSSAVAGIASPVSASPSK